MSSDKQHGKDRRQKSTDMDKSDKLSVHRGERQGKTDVQSKPQAARSGKADKNGTDTGSKGARRTAGDKNRAEAGKSEPVERPAKVSTVLSQHA